MNLLADWLAFLQQVPLKESLSGRLLPKERIEKAGDPRVCIAEVEGTTQQRKMATSLGTIILRKKTDIIMRKAVWTGLPEVETLLVMTAYESGVGTNDMKPSFLL